MTYNPKIHHRRSIRLKGYDYARPGNYFITICTHNQRCRFGRIVGEFPADAVTPDRRHIRFAGIEIGDAEEVPSFEMRNPNDADAINACMELNELGQIAYDEWLKLPQRFPNCQLGVFQIMPNHIHGIIELVDVAAAVSNTDAPVPDASTPDRDVLMSNVPTPDADVPVFNASTPDPNVHVPDDWYQERRFERRSREGAAEGVEGIEGAVGVVGVVGVVGENKGATARVARTGDVVGAYKSLVFNGCLEIFKARNEMMGKLWHRNYYEHIIRDVNSYERISNYIINNPRRWKEDRFFL